jgi:stearoyl-CoA desaturase (delta-9 desaturase)
MQDIAMRSAPYERFVVHSSRVATVKRAFILANFAMSLLGWILAIREVQIGRAGFADLFICFVMCVLTGVGVELGFHRLITHRSFKCVAAVRIALGVFGSMAAQGPIIGWASIHRMHHKYCDTGGDPHTPLLFGASALGKWRGFWHAHVGWQFNDMLPISSEFAKDLLRDRHMQALTRLYVPLMASGLVFPALLGVILIGGWQGAYRGFVWGGLFRWFWSTNWAYSVNSFCHLFGKRVFRTPDGSRNLWWLALPTFGSAWHNDHHAFPSSAIVGFSSGQIDLSGLIVRWLVALGWAYDVRMPSVGEREQRRLTVSDQDECEA